jgi:hypothetical protein
MEQEEVYTGPERRRSCGENSFCGEHKMFTTFWKWGLGVASAACALGITLVLTLIYPEFRTISSGVVNLKEEFHVAAVQIRINTDKLAEHTRDMSRMESEVQEIKFSCPRQKR